LVFEADDRDDNHCNRFGRGERGLKGVFELDTATGVRWDAPELPKAKGVHARYQWELSGPNGGQWWIDVNDGTYKMGKGKIDNPSVTFVTSDKDWVALSNGALGGKWAYFTGRLKIRGSQSVARKLDEIFP
jgi:hypothetical protein